MPQLSSELICKIAVAIKACDVRKLQQLRRFIPITKIEPEDDVLESAARQEKREG